MNTIYKLMSLSALFNNLVWGIISEKQGCLVELPRTPSPWDNAPLERNIERGEGEGEREEYSDNVSLQERLREIW